MRVEQIRQRGFPQQRLNILARLVAIAEPRPEVDDPRATPARVTAAARQSFLQRQSRRRREFRRAISRNLFSGMQREEMRDVPMPRLVLLELLAPFHQPTVAANLRPLQSRQSVFHFSHDARVLVREGQCLRSVRCVHRDRRDALRHYTRRFEIIIETIPDDFLFHRRRHAERSGLSVCRGEFIFR